MSQLLANRDAQNQAKLARMSALRGEESRRLRRMTAFGPTAVTGRIEIPQSQGLAHISKLL
jgi:hypothetical protein